MRANRFALATAIALLAGAIGAAQASDAPREDSRDAATQAPPICGKNDGTTGTCGDTAKTLYRRGLNARKAGDERGAKRYFTRAVTLDPDHVASRAALGHVRLGSSWLSREEGMRAKGLVRRGGEWLLEEEAAIRDQPAAERAARLAGQKKAGALLRAYRIGDRRARRFAASALDQIPDEHKLEPMAFALRSRNRDVRLLAAKSLGEIGNRRALRPLLHRVIHDPAEEIRHAAFDAAAAIGDRNLIAPLVSALGSQDMNTRIHAAEGLARARDVRGVRYLIYRFEAHGGGAPRVYSMFTSQVSFIQDFDVEVASTAFIADPIVGTIQEGIVLDAQVVATQQIEHFVEREVIYGALTELTGATDVENKKGAWAAWFREHGKALEAAAATAPTAESAASETAAR